MKIQNRVLRYEWLAILFLAIPAVGSADDSGVRYYMSLGTSLSVGVQPDATGVNQLTAQGYADQLFDIMEPGFRKIRLVKLGCPGETTATMMNGGICEYDEGSQLAEAVQFLHAHKGKIELITIDMGVNDILAAGCIVGTDVDEACIGEAFQQIGTNLPLILQAITQAADPGTPIIGVNYYNSFLAFWLTGPEGQQLAIDSAGLAYVLNNDVLAMAYGAFSIPVANVAGAFRSNDFVPMVPFPPPFYSVPLNVAMICQLTWMCAPSPIGPNIHANPTGYGVMAATIAAILP